MALCRVYNMAHVYIMAPQTMPRQKHPLWKEFDITVPKDPPRKPLPDVRCRHCSTQLQNVQPGRALLSHIVICERITEQQRAQWRRFQKKEKEEAAAAQRLERTTESDVEANIAAMFYAANLSFRAIENPAIRAALLQGRPDGLRLPSRRALAGSMLDQAYEAELAEVISVQKEQKHFVSE
ncbi:hypothetical protein PHMEG_00028829 [Phytophthora megakarya]|uniref:Uncharacterized protein n=1 Tax=Phytophthora megakarya TaxID=4795 RepID=A0A225V421_9STRA|nr:hypothetical protein PHMEG_00028829 [Phytophthora megakarya]